MRRSTRLGWLVAGAVVAAMAASGRAEAATYRCSPQGSDSNDGLRAPWRTLQRAAGVVRAGDTVVLADGTYAGGVVHRSASGRSGAPITYRAERAGGAVIRGGRIGILIEHSDWVTLDGLTIKDAQQLGLRCLVAHHVTVQNCTITGTGATGMLTGFCDDLRIENNDVFANGKGFYDPEEGRYRRGHGIYVSCSGDRPVIRNNRCYENSGSGIQLNANAGELGPQRGMRADGFISAAVIQDNLIYRNGRGDGGAGLNLVGLRDSLVYNNLLYHNGAGGIACFADGHGPSWGCRNNRFINNTVYFRPNEGRYALQFVEGSRGNVVRNNILVAGRGAAIEFDAESGAPDSDYNLLYSAESGQLVRASGRGCTLLAWQGQGRDRHSCSAPGDEVFMNPQGPRPSDFRLSATSPGVGVGTRLPALALAPAGRAIDLGWRPAAE